MAHSSHTFLQLNQRPIDRILAPLMRVVDRLGLSALSGILLSVACVVALVWANSSWQESYLGWLEAPITLGVGGATLSMPAVLWINDLLMAVFFLLVGLEIKREVLGGELGSLRKAALPVTAAIGGVVAPALIFFAFNPTGEAARGWAVPAATDIAFVLGIIALLGSRIPLALKVFLTTVAVVDDIVAVLIIAVFYTAEVSLFLLLGAAGVLVLLFALNRLGVERTAPYLVLGAALWLLVLGSGVHATIAGVLLAFAIPARSRLNGEGFTTNVEALLAEGEDEGAGQAALVRTVCDHSESLLLRWEHALAPWVLMVVMPVFALANAGVVFGDGGAAALTSSVAVGVGLGLLLGKPIGITVAALVAVKSGLAARPAGVSWRQLHGAAWLAGIGFTMSLFVADLAFGGSSHLAEAKIGLMVGSLFAAVVGVSMLVAAAGEASRLRMATGAEVARDSLQNPQGVGHAPGTQAL